MIKEGLLVSFILVLLVSVLLASVFGHGIHWMLHQRWAGPAYRGHMEHHLELYPPSSLTSKAYKPAKWYHRGPVLFTPGFVIILAATWGLTSVLTMPLWVTVTFGVVMLVYGFGNDWIHDSFHITDHWLNRYAWYGRLRELHYIHHRNMRRNFGIANFTWDRVLGTFREK